MLKCGLRQDVSFPRPFHGVYGLLWMVTALASPLIPQTRAEAASVAVVLAPHEAYKTAAAAAEKTLREKGHAVRLYELPRTTSPTTAGATSSPLSTPVANPELLELVRQLEGARPAVIVTLGEQATWTTLENTQSIPVVYGMVTNAPDFAITDKGHAHHPRVAGVTTDILPKMQLRWIAKVQPQAKNLAVLHSPRSKRTAEAIRQAGKETGHSVALIEASKDDFAKGMEELSRQGCDALLMIADAQVYTKDTVRPALLWGLRQKKGVWAFSESFVKSGALGGLYTSYESVGQQTARIAIRVISGEAPSKIGLEYPEQVRKAINERTAGMIGLTLPGPVLNETTVRYGNE